jgi:hypothetical protein
VVLAESVSIDGGALVAILAVLLVVLLVGAAGVVLGFVWAWRAGRGSMHSLVGLLMVVALEVMGAFASGFLTLLPAVGQVATYAVSRARHPATSTANGLEDDGRP